MKDMVVGLVLKNEKVVGTGFLVSPNVFMTVKHNVLTPEELINEVIDERDIIIRFQEDDYVKGKTINLREAVKKNIDCVLISLNEDIIENDFHVLLESEQSISEFECNIVGFSKLTQEKIKLMGIITNESADELLIYVKKNNQLQDYDGLSGSPVMVLDNVIAIVTRQLDCEHIQALPIKYIVNNMDYKGVEVAKRKLPNVLNASTFDLNSICSKVQEIITAAGPRYSKDLNLKTVTYNTIKFWLEKDSSKEKQKLIAGRIAELIRKLKDFDEYNKGENLSSNANRQIIDEVVCGLQEKRELFSRFDANYDNIKEFSVELKEFTKRIVNVFEIEKEQFEEKNGKGTYNNQSWRGFMASYMCEFPAQYLDELRDSINILDDLSNMLEPDLLKYANLQTMLLTGKGGIGKTHLLCDLVNEYIENELPAILLYGDMFNENRNYEAIFENVYSLQENIDKIFAWFDEYGARNNLYIPICIDAINETTDTNYWNRTLPLLFAKLKKYSNLKIIISCRTIYLEEYLDSDKTDNMYSIVHKGFEELEEEALSRFCDFYGVTINYDTTNIPEFMNPLFLKMLCEIAQNRDNKTVVVEDIQALMNEFFNQKNKIITAQYAEYFSVRDNVVNLILEDVTEYMSENDYYSISWNELRYIVSQRLEKFGVKEKTAGFVKLLISENLLRESDEESNQITFSYQKFYEFIHSQKYIKMSVDKIIDAVQTRKITLGTLEMLQIEYYKHYQQEFINKIGNQIHAEAIDTFFSGLYWRKKAELGDDTKDIISTILRSDDVNDIRRAVFGLLSISTKVDCNINAKFIHNKLAIMNNYNRDYFLSYFLLKRYDQEKILFDLCERATSLEVNSFPSENIYLWKIVLCWGCGLNDIKLRDKASKGLTNLFKLYPADMVDILDLFININDDYIHERIWQAIYSALIILREYKYSIIVMNYVEECILVPEKWPQNVLIRDYIRNIFEFAYYKGWCDDSKIKMVRPPYKSKKHLVNKEWIKQHKEDDSRLFWNCTESDFIKYTVPSEVQDYGISEEEVGYLIYEDIVKSGYICSVIGQAKYDVYIDYTYGSLRSRDEQVERIGKKYQKIFLYREMGNIYDNYPYSPRYRYDEVEIVQSQQGDSFRNIDLTMISTKNNFDGVSLEYPFFRYKRWSDNEWFKNKDIERYIAPLLSCTYNNEEYYIIQGYLSSEETKKKDYREIWMQIRLYLYDIDKKQDLLRWFKDKNFAGRWMPEGFSQMYENCIGEYPWSPTMVNYLSGDEKQDFRQEKAAPCYLYTTANDYIPEKDSPFCGSETGSYMLPGKILWEKMNLVWNGATGYISNGKTVIYNSKNAIFIHKEFFQDFLLHNNLGAVWTILGEKQKITGGFGRDFPGYSEFSYTYFIDDNASIVKNHEFYNIMESQRY